MASENNKSTDDSTTAMPNSERFGLAGKSSSSLSFLEGELDNDTMDTVLSYLTQVDYSNLSLVSKRMNEAVSLSSHLRMDDFGIFGKNPLRASVATHRDCTSHETDLTALSSDTFERLMMRFKNLSVLDLRGFGAVGDDLIDMLNRCPSALTLKSIALHDCELSEGCTHSIRLENLASLTLTATSSTPRLTSLLENSRNLTSFTCKHSLTLTDRDVAGLGRILGTSLEELILNYTKLTKPVGSFPKLTHASFAFGSSLTGLSKMDCPNLTVLDLTYCVRLSDTQIEKVVCNSPALEKLVIVECLGVHSLHLESPSLRHLDASFTHNLSDLSLQCPALEQLSTTCCLSLKSVSLEIACSLRMLSLGGLVELRALRITQARNLVRLDLRWCRRLDHCQIDCPNLRAANLGGCKKAVLSCVRASEMAPNDEIIV
eukprot:jgi/Psemu1/285312/fgenesh1_pg.81_\